MDLTDKEITLDILREAAPRRDGIYPFQDLKRHRWFMYYNTMGVNTSRSRSWELYASKDIFKDQLLSYTTIHYY